MTQEELDAGGQAVMNLATAHGFGSFLNIDQAREIAAAVIHAVEAVRFAKAPPPTAA